MYEISLEGNLLALLVCKEPATHCAIFYNFKEAVRYCIDRSIREGTYPAKIEITEGALNYARDADGDLNF